jgi:4-alpha-glucanotransferase
MLSPVGFQSHPVHFGRAFTPEELALNQDTLYQAKVALSETGKQADRKNLGIIVPVRSLPTWPSTGLGSLYGGRDAMVFLNKIGFDKIQLDPEGVTGPMVSSPYMGSLFSRSPMQIDLQALEGEAWGGILPWGTAAKVAKLVAENPYKEWSPYAVNYNKAYELTHKASPWKTRPNTTVLKYAFAKFKTNGTEAGKSRHQAFEAFKQMNGIEKTPLSARENLADTQWLERDALFDYLANTVYRNDDWQKQWRGEQAEVDKYLFAVEKRPDLQGQVKARLQQLEKMPGFQDAMDLYAFTQFLYDQQRQDLFNYLKGQGIEVHKPNQPTSLGLMGDVQVGFSNRDTWAYQDLILDGWLLGVGPDNFGPEGQAWGFAVVNPAKVFDLNTHRVDPDSLGAKFFKQLFTKMLKEYPGGLRIDHTIGLIDPWVYPAKGAPKDGRRLYSTPNLEEIASFSRVNKSELSTRYISNPMHNQWVRAKALNALAVKRYASFIQDIIVPAAKANGVSPDAVMFEDLGTVTNPVRKVIDRYKLRGLRVSQFADAEIPADPSSKQYRRNANNPANLEPQHFYDVSTHDTPSTLEWLGTQEPNQLQERLASYLTEEQQAAVSAENRHPWLSGLISEALATKARDVQLMFTDWLGWSQTYNRPGTVNTEEYYGVDSAQVRERHKDDGANWRLRLPQGPGKTLQNSYYQAVSEGHAPNLPEVFAQAIKARHLDSDKASLITTLNRLATILKEPMPS